MDEATATLSPPTRRSLLLESRAAIDMARMFGPLLTAGFGKRPDRKSPLVIVAPGFGSGDRYTLPLRHYLRRLKFDVEGWGLGTNLAGINLPHTLDDLSERWQPTPKPVYRGEASVPYLCDLYAERVAQRHEETGRQIALVGWSLGGYLSREVARDLPDVVDRVITMGSPTIGGPKYTLAADFFVKRGMDLDWIEEEILKRESRPITQPITAIFSKTDGIVSWQAAIDHHSERVTHIEVSAAHLGMGFNPTIWSHIVTALDAEVGGTKPVETG